MYNSKDKIIDKDLTFLSYNQTINKEFTLQEIKNSDLWVTDTSTGLVKAIPLFNCDSIVSDNPSDTVFGNECIICENVNGTLIQCTSNDTGGIHYYTVELYSYAPYSKLDVISEVSVYCIVYDEYLNRLGNVNVDVYVDDTLIDTVLTDHTGVARYKVDQACSVVFKYGSVESNVVTISGDD